MLSSYSCGRRSPLAKSIAIVLCTLLHAAAAHADDAVNPMFSFSGFGTLGVVHANVRNSDFTTSIFKPNGAGFSHQWSADVDSLIGVQLNANFTPRLSAVVQVIA